MPLRDVYGLNLPGPPPDGQPPPPPKEAVGACAWSGDGLLAFASNSSKPSGQRGVVGFTASPSIYVLHVDRPERHSLLSGGHEHDITHLAWAPVQMGMCLLSADGRSAICIWKPVDGLINRWALSHRLLCQHVKHCQFINAAPSFALPSPFAGAASHAAYTNVHMAKNASYDSKYRKDLVARKQEASGAPVLPDVTALAPAGCLCILVVTRYGEVRVFQEMCAGPTVEEWGSTSARLCSLELPETNSRASRSSTGNPSSSAPASESAGGCNSAVLYVQKASAALKDTSSSLILAVCDESQILVFNIRVRFSPLRLQVTPHTRYQLKSDIRLMPLVKMTWGAPLLQLVTLDPSRHDVLFIVFSVGVGDAYKLKLERLKMAPRKTAAAAIPGEADAMIWQATASALLPPTNQGVCISSVTILNGGQDLVLAYSDGKLEVRQQETLVLRDEPLHMALSPGGAVVAGCSSPSGFCALFLESDGKAKVVEVAHSWALDAAATVASISGCLVHHLEVCLAKQSDPWDVLLTLGGIVTSHPQGLSIYEAVTKLLRENYKQQPGQHSRFYRHVFEILTLRVHAISRDHLFLCTSSEARLLLFYLLDCFRFALPVMPRSDQLPSRNGALSTISSSHLKALCSKMMLTMGESIVGLTVWNLKQATTNIKAEKVRQQQAAAGQGAGHADALAASSRASMTKNFLLDAEALTFTRDLLSYYLKKVQERKEEDPKGVIVIDAAPGAQVALPATGVPG
eukprot:CAMPEP_0180376544 /NCGR_PEP_ID=MMETSP0989-20121125/23490_1 /TAXON_ID=697907 /ORGANISM="non described non described, Strain CCMP2293" /LENGTH=743 /DNA_ID=CAMNT_0022374803 /DNA_START=55 /DNA_END=2282 /DNA_ORIENTATION=-